MNRPLALLVVLALISTSHGADPARFEYEEPHMGTKFRVVLYAPDKATADQAAAAAFARVAELNRVMSDFLPTSDLSLLCQKSATVSAGPVKVSDDLFFVLSKSREIAAMSDGAFDVTIAPVIKLWRQARKDRRLPDPDMLQTALKKVGYQKMVLNEKAGTVDLRVAGMQLDLGGIGKGFAADAGLEAIAKFGVTSALVAASGDIAVSGPPPGKAGWRIDIAALPGSKEKRTLLLHDAAVSTSGDAEQFVEIGGVRYSHIVDPKTGHGLTGRRSVSVIARRGYQADGMTKMAMIMPADKAIEAIEKVEGVATLIVIKNPTGEDVKQSKRFAAFVAKE